MFIINVEETKLYDEVAWFKILTRKGRYELYTEAISKKNYKLVGLLILIDRKLRSKVMSEERIISEALREIAEALGYEKVIRMILPKDHRAREILKRILREFEAES